MAISNKTLKQIAENPLFEKIEDDDLVTMFDCLGFFTKIYEKGEYLIFEKDHVDNIGIILKGSVDIIKEDIWGRRTIISRLSNDEMLGETFACSGDNMSTITYQAAMRTSVFFMPFSRVMHTCRKTCPFHHRLIENMVSFIAEKNRLLIQKVEVISGKTLRDKLLTFFSLQVQEHGSFSFTLPMGRKDLAEYIGANRSALTRELNAMSDDGLIEFDRNDFVIHPGQSVLGDL